METLTIQSRLTCPHCWNEFAPEESLWISEHPDLMGDMRLGPSEPLRFLPSRFSVEGDAIDPEGSRCSRLACPQCHLEIARPLYQIPPLFFSIFGAPSCGKSYFLASMTWRLRHVLPKLFGLSLNDADAIANQRLHDYEADQFMNPNPDKLVALQKTPMEGDLYDEVMMGESVRLPKPFLLTVQPLARHPQYQQSKKISRVLTVYDNAGESFLPGQDSTRQPVTRHLAVSRFLFFLFDPTQDPRFRRACLGKTKDPQMLPRSERLEREATVRQDTILLEAIQRVRRHAGLREDELHQRPLVIVVTKWDTWASLLEDESFKEPYIPNIKLGISVLDAARVQRMSQKLGDLLRELTPEVVAAAEGFARELVFVPVSAIGGSPVIDPDSQKLAVRPADIKPIWAEVPLLYAMNRWSTGLIGATQ